MHYWNYRVIRRTFKEEDSIYETYTIAEVYYDENYNITNFVACDENDIKNIAPFGSTHEELKNDLEYMLKACKLPFLDYDELKDLFNEK